MRIHVDSILAQGKGTDTTREARCSVWCNCRIDWMHTGSIRNVDLGKNAKYCRPVPVWGHAVRAQTFAEPLCRIGTFAKFEASIRERVQSNRDRSLGYLRPLRFFVGTSGFGSEH
jgi:hypothetical protein